MTLPALRRLGAAVRGSPRWLLALAILALVALGLSGVSRTPLPPGPALPADDEILAYHIDEARDLVIKIPIEIDAVEITTWAAIMDRPPPGEGSSECDSGLRYPYGFTAAFVDEQGSEAARHDYDLESRVSCDASRPAGAGEYAARLARSGEPVTDPRTTLIITRDVLPRGGLLRLRAKPAALDPALPSPLGSAHLALLTRIEGRYQRGEALRAIFEQSLDAEERRQIARGVSALGFADLPGPAKDAVLTLWARRLEAAGVDGTDYHVSRLLLRRYRTPYPRAERGPRGFKLGERYAVALNLRGPIDLRIEGPAGRVVRVADGRDAAHPVRLEPPFGTAVVRLARGDIRTAVIDGVGDDFDVRFSVPRAQVAAQIGEIVHVATADGFGFETPPDVRIVRYLNLDPEHPIITRIAPGQQLLGLMIRAEIDPASGIDSGDAAVIARWGSGPGAVAELRVSLPRSRFEWWTHGLGPTATVTDATEPRLAILHVPPDVHRIEITGDPRTRVRLRTIEPGVNETLYRIPYRVPLAADEVWRYAPFDVSTWTDIRAVNLDELERAGRSSDLREQVRIERSGRGARQPGEAPERTLLPEHAPVRRRFLVPAYQSAGEGYPSDAWTPLLVPKNLVIERDGPRAERLFVVYRAARDRLGKDVTLRIDGKVAKTDPIVTRSGTLHVPVGAGAHHVLVEGLGESGAAYVDAAPAEGGAIVRRRDVHELTRARPMTFRFKQAPGETLHLVLFVVTEGKNESFRIRYAIEGVKPASRQGVFFRRVTLPDGILAGRTGDFGKGTLFESAGEQRGADGMARVVIRLGDDLKPGERLVRLQLQSPVDEDLAKRVWIAAVLVGQGPEGKTSEPRLWTEDDQ